MQDKPIETNIMPVKYAIFKYLVIGIIGLGIAFKLYTEHYLIWAGIATFFTLVVLLVIAMMRRGICPTCQKEMSGFLEIDSCPHCGAYSYIVNKQLKPVNQGFVALTPRFKSHFWDLRHPSLWKWPSPKKCCTCGESATFFNQLDVRITTGFSGVVLTVVEKNVYTFEIGSCCKEHQDGVECENLSEGVWPQDKDADNDDALLFRSYDYWQQFNLLNGR